MPRRRTVHTSQTTAIPAPTKATRLAQGDPAAIAARFKDFPAIDVLTRRFHDPNDPGSLPILLKDESPDACVNSEHMNRLKPGATTCHLCKPRRPARIWYVRWFNLASEGRNAQMKSKGYVPVQIKELQDSGDVADLFESQKDKAVRRGDRGQEVLAKMPLEAYTHVKAVQRAAWNARANSKAKLRSDLAEAASGADDLGSALEREEAAETISRGGIQVESMRQIRTTLGDEANATDESA